MWDNNLEVGKKYNKLTVVSFARKRWGAKYYNCICECGGTIRTNIYSLRNGHTTSCGCVKLAKSKLNGTNFYKHGYRYHPLYATWRDMQDRCDKSNHISYKYYGAKGIKVCDEWRNFYTFISDMGPKPSLDHSIDRINGNLGYFKDNCKWSTPKEQRANRTPYIPNKVSVHTNTVTETVPLE